MSRMIMFRVCRLLGMRIRNRRRPAPSVVRLAVATGARWL